jgi:hypothetical protein
MDPEPRMLHLYIAVFALWMMFWTLLYLLAYGRRIRRSHLLCTAAFALLWPIDLPLTVLQAIIDRTVLRCDGERLARILLEGCKDRLSARAESDRREHFRRCS